MKTETKCCENPFLVPLCGAFHEMFPTFDKSRHGFCRKPQLSQGVSDGNEGVQWHAGFIRDTKDDPWTRYVGVNMEGIKYEDNGWHGGNCDGRPLLYLLEAESERPRGRVFDAISSITQPEGISVHVLLEKWIAQTPDDDDIQPILKKTPLDTLTEEHWRFAARSARIRSRPHDKPRIFPHLMFRYELRAEPITKDEWIEAVTGAKDKMQPLYDFVACNTR